MAVKRRGNDLRPYCQVWSWRVFWSDPGRNMEDLTAAHTRTSLIWEYPLGISSFCAALPLVTVGGQRSMIVASPVDFSFVSYSTLKMDRVKRIWYLSPMRAAMVQASLRIRAVSPEPPLLAHTSSESRETFRQKARSLAPLNGWACAVKICHGMLAWRGSNATNSLDGAQMISARLLLSHPCSITTLIGS